MRKNQWKIKEMKKNARMTLKKNYWSAVIICLILAIFTSSFTYTTLMNLDITNGSTTNDLQHGIQIFESLLQNIGIEKEVFASRGALAALYRSITSSGSIIYGIIHAITQFIFGREIFSGILILIGIILYIVYWLFIGNMLTIGARRFFLESHKYYGTQPGRILFAYKIRRTRKVAAVMLREALYLLFWTCFTLIGGIIKMYSYKMIPYLLAENPDIPRKEIFRISRQMMKGSKWKAFLMEVSFFGWYLLSMLTLGFLSILFINPYKTAADTELYYELRKKYLEEHPEDKKWLNDNQLTKSTDEARYPLEAYPISEASSRKWISPDYHQTYPPLHLVMMFFSFMLIGWIWEVALEIFGKGIFVNRGTLFGPWLPLYGCGGVLLVLILRKLVHRPVLTYFLATGICAVIEYFTGYFLEHIRGLKWWDYTGYFVNLHGRICLEGLIVFGIGGCLGLYFLVPMLHNVFSRIPRKVKIALCTVLIILFACDLLYSTFHPNTGENITITMNQMQQD